MGFEPLEDRRLLSVVGIDTPPTADEVPPEPQVFFVDVNAAGNNDGTTWTDAYTDLQDALAVAASGEEIWVAEGIYTPAGPGGDRAATFQLVDGAAVYGGFPSGGGAFNERQPAAYETALHGDLDANDAAVAQPEDLLGHPTREDNVYHVVTSIGCGVTTVLDGLTVTGGNADGDQYDDKNGGGIYVYSGSPTLNHLTIRGNTAVYNGGGMYGNAWLSDCTLSGNAAQNWAGGISCGSSTFDYCTIEGNWAGYSAGGASISSATLNHCVVTGNHSEGAAGGIDAGTSAPTLNSCTISGNSAATLGGGLDSYEGNPILNDCLLVDNSAESGGAIAMGDCHAVLTGCRLLGNSADSGGGIWMYGYSQPTLVNCELSGNAADSGGGTYVTTGSTPTLLNCTLSENSATGNGGGIAISGNYDQSPVLANCIFWGNQDIGGTDESAQIDYQNGTPTVDYCSIQGWSGVLGGTGNLGDDPRWLDPHGTDNLLGTEDDDLRLSAGSPCIDAGDNAAVPGSVTLDLGGNPRIAGGTVDMGAHEFIAALPIGIGDRWQYFKGITEPPADWSQLQFDDRAWQSGPTGVGYGDGDDATVLGDMQDGYASVYARRLFRVDDPAALTSLVLTIDYDDAFVAYLNGVRVAANNVDGDPPAFDALANEGHEASAGDNDPNPPEVIDLGGFIDQLFPGANVLAIQGHNTSLGSSDFSLIPALVGRPAVIYVDDDAAGDPAPGDPTVGDPLEDGTEAHPFDAIQEAIVAAEVGDTVMVLDGTYTGAGNRDVDFLGKAITVRSQNGPEQCIVDCQGSEVEPHRGFHFDSGEGADSILEGFTITGGNRPESSFVGTNGGGAISVNASPTIRNNWIIGNSAYYGGGIVARGAPTIIDNLIADNSAVDGGGINCFEQGTIANNTISQNTAQRGGGMWIWEDLAPTVINNTISENWAEEAGGGIGILWDFGSLIAGNLIVANGTAGSGGGIYLSTGDVTIVNNTIVGNTAGGGVYRLYATPDITNCILWDNGDDLVDCAATYSCIEDGDPGEGNVSLDPLFVDPVAGDYRLLAGSPGVNAGDNSAVPASLVEDLDGNPRIADGVVDMGAYELPSLVLVDHFGFSTIGSPQYTLTPFGVTITALDAYGRTVTEFNGAAELSGWVATATTSTIVVSEVDVSSPDTMEFTNVSGTDVDLSGWQVLVYDRNSGTSPLPAFTIPPGTVCPAGDVFVVEQKGTAPGAYPHLYTGEEISWQQTGATGVLLLDAAGEVVDFMAACDLDPAAITAPLTIVPDFWQGAQVPPLVNASDSYQRIGDGDHDHAGDWVQIPSSIGTANPGLTIPFAGEVVSVAIAPTLTGAFTDGVWTGDVTVLEEAVGMYLRADDGSGHTGDSSPFDVELRPAEIRGSKWNDLNANGAWDAAEPGLPGWKIYVDEDQSGAWEDGEPFDVTDADGNYAITGLAAGTHIVGEVFHDDWEQTFPGTSGGAAAAPQGSVSAAPSPSTLAGTGSASEEVEVLLDVLGDPPGEPADVDTTWIDGAGPSALRNLNWESLPAAGLLPAEPAFAGTGVFNIYVEQGLLSQIDAALGTYAADLTLEGYQVSVQEFAGTAAELRSELQSQWNSNALEAALFVGDLPYVMFTSEDNFNSTPVRVSYPHDLYFMDLDGSYVFHPGDLDEHTDGSGDVGPEIYVSRITTGNLGGVTGQDEVALIDSYFAKAHAYRTGNLDYENRGIVFADDDWDNWGASQMTALYADVLAVNDPAETTKQGYLDTLQLNYESILECIHSSATSHSLKVGGSWESISNLEILNANPRQGFYNMFNCSSARFTSSNHLAGVYVYGGDYGLNAVGSTKTGSMLAFPYFYRPQGEGDSVGQAFMQWFDHHAASTVGGIDYYVDWFYGMTMQGDPTLRPASMPGDRTGTHTVQLAAGQIVEDVHFGNHAEIDFGDAPDPTHPTWAINHGAGHVLAPGGPFLGNSVDADQDGQPTALADGDDNDGSDDDDGVTFAGVLIVGSQDAGVQIDMTASPADGVLSAWIDFNGDGDWEDPGEQIFADEPLTAGTVHGLSFAVPSTAVAGTTYARFRLDSQGGLSFGGLADDGEVEDYTVEIDSHVESRYVFYNNSYFDDVSEGGTDDDAIATDKTALQAPLAATFANYTSYSGGLNGIMIDIAGLPVTSLSPANDFLFAAGNDGTPGGWAPLSVAPSVMVRPGEGVNGSDRVMLIWPDHDPADPLNTAVARQWLQVTVLANANTGLGSPDTFYFGNAIGEVGNLSGEARVNILDLVQTRNAISGATVPMDNAFDFNRDSRVNILDLVLCRNNIPTTLYWLTAPSSPPEPGGMADALSLALSSGYQVLLQDALTDAAVVDEVNATDVSPSPSANVHLQNPPPRSVSRPTPVVNSSARALFGAAVDLLLQHDDEEDERPEPFDDQPMRWRPDV